MEKHNANIKLGKVIRNEIDNFFNEGNERQYLKYYTETEAEVLRNSTYGKKNVSLIKTLSKELGYSEKTFYHMLEGNNSQFDKIVRVLEFFGLTFEYNVFSSEEDIVDSKKYNYIKNLDIDLSDVESELMESILTLDKDTQQTLYKLIMKVR